MTEKPETKNDVIKKLDDLGNYNFKELKSESQLMCTCVMCKQVAEKDNKAKITVNLIPNWIKYELNNITDYASYTTDSSYPNYNCALFIKDNINLISESYFNHLNSIVSRKVGELITGKVNEGYTIDTHSGDPYNYVDAWYVFFRYHVLASALYYVASARAKFEPGKYFNFVEICNVDQWLNFCEMLVMQHMERLENSGVTILEGKFNWMKLKKFKTQKAKGVMELINCHYSVIDACSRISPLNYECFTELDQIRPELFKKGKTLFARPCPVTPRHGFVDSRPVASYKAAVDVFKEAKEVDSEAELLLGEYIDASHNMIWANGQLTIGPGHDGATSGKESIVFPTLDILPVPFNPEKHKWKSIKDSAFFELVASPKSGKYDTATIYLTQLRDGPVMPKTVDYIPYEMEVTNVVLAEGDLLEWETKAKEFTKGTVVYHPGGSLSSHYSIHCFNSGIPIVVSFEPVVGQVLKPTTTGYSEWNKKGFIQGANIGLGIRPTFISPRNALCFVLSVLHNAIAFDKGNFVHSAWLGMASAFAVRLGFTAALGEARHCRRNDNRSKNILEIGNKNRERIYDDMWEDAKLAKSKVKIALEWFYDQEAWSSGYGGHNWFRCLFSTIELWNDLCEVAQDKAEVNVAIDSLNKVVNMAHNNGRFLNKFCDNHIFDVGARNPSTIALSTSVHIYKLTSLIDPEAGNKGLDYRVNQDVIPSFRRILPTIDFKFGFVSINEAQINVREKLLHIQVRASNRSEYYSYNIPFDKFSASDLNGILGALAFPDAGFTKASLAGSGTPYLSMVVKDNRYLLVHNQTLEKDYTIFDCATILPGCMVEKKTNPKITYEQMKEIVQTIGGPQPDNDSDNDDNEEECDNCGEYISSCSCD